MNMFNIAGISRPTTRREIASILALSFLLFECSLAIRPGRVRGECVELKYGLEKEYPVQSIQIPVDHFHNETRYEPHSDEYFSNRFWYTDVYYRHGGPVIIQNAGEEPGDEFLADLQIGLLHELARATNGMAVLLEHRYYGGSLPMHVRTLKDFRFLSVEQAMADQAYFAQNVVFPGKEELNLTAPNTPWFAIGGSYPGALTAYERIQYPDLFWGAIASSAVTVNKENNWEYMNAVREYSPPECVAVYGKIINVADSILLGGNETEIMQFKGLFRYANVNGSNADFANRWLNFPFSTQGVTWIPCLSRYDGLEYCRDLTATTVLYPKAEKFKDTVKGIFAKSKWADETESLTTSFLNYLGYENDLHKDNSSAISKRQPGSLGDSSKVLRYGESYLAWSYQQCTEIGNFQTADAPTNTPGTLPIISSLITLHYLRNMYCRNQLYLNLTEIPVSSNLDRYGGYNLSYPRLMLTGGELDPWRPTTPLATLDTPTRLNYSSTPSQPWYVVPGEGHISDLYGIFPSQRKPGVPPEGIIRVHELEKDSFIRWLKEWHELHPSYNVYAQQQR